MASPTPTPSASTSNNSGAKTVASFSSSSLSSSNDDGDADDKSISISILERYDGFLVDQWGVMHNGAVAMEHAPECITALSETFDKKMVILSNSPSSEEETLKALIPLGFNPLHFQGGAVTSGMLASAYIAKTYGGTKHNNNTNTSSSNENNDETPPPSKVLCMGWTHPQAPSAKQFLERCGNIQLVDSIEDDPEVLIVQGNEYLMGPKTYPSTTNNSSKGNDDGEEEEEKENSSNNISLGDFVFSGDTSKVIDPLLQQCATRQLPLICVDPDFISVNPDKSVLYMPGTIAKRYEDEYGGTCVYFGKPHAPGFEEGIQRLLDLGVSDKSRIAMIGDSLHHDVTGANLVGIDSILVLGGVHRNELGNDLGEMAPQDKLEALFAKERQTPTIVAPLLKL